jgi:hypothetical protein
MKQPDVTEVRAVEGGSEHREHGRPPPWGWAVNTPPGSVVAHMVPTWDVAQHWNQDCPCGPALDASGYLVHKSFDGRERHEQGGAPLH